MSKIAETKANQWILNHKDGDVLYVQDAYIAAYDQSLQDFLEKSCEWLEDQVCYYSSMEYNGDTYEKEIVVDTDNMIKQFRNYMQDESEN